MSFSRLLTGERIMGVAGVLLLASLFTEWWSASIIDIGTLGSGIGVTSRDLGLVESYNAFAGSPVNDAIWVVTALGAIAVALVAANRSNVNSPIALSAVVTLLAAISLLFALGQLFEPPAGMQREYGLFIGLLAMVSILVGGWLAMNDEADRDSRS